MASALTVPTTCAKLNWIRTKQKSKNFDFPHFIALTKSILNSYTLVISQYEKTATIYYTLRAYCRDKFELVPLPSTYPSMQKVYTINPIFENFLLNNSFDFRFKVNGRARRRADAKIIRKRTSKILGTVFS